MKFHLLLFCFFIVKLNIYGQNCDFRIRVIAENNKYTGNPLISINNKFQETIKSDSTGGITLGYINEKSLNLEIKCYGYQPIDTVIFNNCKIYSIKLAPISLKEIEIIAKRPIIERKSDRIIYNLNNSITSSSGDITSALNNAPGIKIIQNNITLYGKTPKVLFDDKVVPFTSDELIDYLKTISAETILKFEIMNNPNASFEAQGEGGVINIISKKNTINGLFTTFQTSLQKATFFTNSYLFNLGFKNKTLSFSINYNYLKGAILETARPVTYFANETWYETNYTKENSLKKKLNIILNYELSKKLNLETVLNLLDSKPSSFSEDNILIPKNTKSSTTTKTIFSVKKSFSIDLNGNYKIDTSGKTILFGVSKYHRNFDNINNNEYSNFLELNYRNFNSLKNEFINLNTLKIDFNLPNRNRKIDFGVKYSNFNSKNNFKYSFDNKSESYVYLFQENILGMYINYSKSIKKVDLLLGLRNEITMLNLQSDTLSFLKNFKNIFPTINIVFNINNLHNLSFNANRRIERPNFYFLNPFKTYSNPYQFEMGNPFLLPYKIFKTEISYIYDNILTVNLGMSKSKKIFEIVCFFDENTKNQLTTYDNYINNTNFSVSLNYYFNKINWLESSNEAILLHNYSKMLIAGKKDIFGFDPSFSSDNNFELNKSKTFLANLHFEYQAPWVYNSFKISGYYSINLGTKLFLYKKKIQLAFEAEDLFKSQYMYQFETTNDINRNTFYYSDNKRFMISIKYKFGKEFS